MTGEKAKCTLPKVNDKEVKIKCILQDALTDIKIMIEQCSIFDGKFRNVHKGIDFSIFCLLSL